MKDNKRRFRVATAEGMSNNFDFKIGDTMTLEDIKEYYKINRLSVPCFHDDYNEDIVKRFNDTFSLHIEEALPLPPLTPLQYWAEVNDIKVDSLLNIEGGISSRLYTWNGTDLIDKEDDGVVDNCLTGVELGELLLNELRFEKMLPTKEFKFKGNTHYLTENEINKLKQQLEDLLNEIK